jgi:peptidoglycan/xylan/chitin deacetylase (PgdA/CDA1 family)
MQHIQEWFHCLSIDDAFADISPHHTKPAAVVTFDDGYVNNLEVALPILEEYRIPAIVYITTRNVTAQELFWPDLIWMVAGQVSPTTVDLSDAAPALSRYVFSSEGHQFSEETLRLLEDIKSIAPEYRGEAVDKIVDRFLSASDGRAKRPPVEGHAFSPLTAEQVAILSRHPLITIGAHTHCHNLLDQIPLQQAEDTIIRSKRILEEISGTAIQHFAYPNGNFNEDIIRTVKNAGFSSAVTFDPGFFTGEGDPFRIRRFGIGADMSLDTFKTKLTGVFELCKWRS